jgi:hypothetical protein
MPTLLWHAATRTMRIGAVLYFAPLAGTAMEARDLK